MFMFLKKYKCNKTHIIKRKKNLILSLYIALKIFNYNLSYDLRFFKKLPVSILQDISAII